MEIQHPAAKSDPLGQQEQELHVATNKTSPPEEEGRIVSPGTDGGGALDDLLDDYQYTSQTNTPGFSPVGFGVQGLSSPERPALKEDEDPEMYEVRNIRRVDASPPRSTPPILPTDATSTESKNAPLDPTTPTTALFLTEVMKSWDKPENLKSNPPPPPPPAQVATAAPTTTNSRAPTTAAPAPTDNSLEEPKSPSSTSADMYASSNYWAQMRAQLKEKRSVSQETSLTSSHKTGDSSSTAEDPKRPVKSPSPAPTSSSGPSRSATKPVPPNADGRSGSFTSYTPIPKFSESHRPSSPVIPYGRPPRPSIDIPTGMRGPSFPGSPEGSGQRRGSASDAKRPIIEIRPSTGNRSTSNSPISGAMPFSAQNDNGGRPSSRNRNREDDMIGKLPVFAPKEGLPDLRADGGGERIGRPQSPARGVPSSSQQKRRDHKVLLVEFHLREVFLYHLPIKQVEHQAHCIIYRKTQKDYQYPRQFEHQVLSNPFPSQKLLQFQ